MRHSRYGVTSYCLLKLAELLLHWQVICWIWYYLSVALQLHVCQILPVFHSSHHESRKPPLAQSCVLVLIWQKKVYIRFLPSSPCYTVTCINNFHLDFRCKKWAQVLAGILSVQLLTFMPCRELENGRCPLLAAPHSQGGAQQPQLDLQAHVLKEVQIHHLQYI